MLVNHKFLVDSVPILNEESAAILAIVKNFKGAIDGCDLVTQKVPAKVSLTGWLPTITSSSI
jgi:hypothetical protein